VGHIRGILLPNGGSFSSTAWGKKFGCSGVANPALEISTLVKECWFVASGVVERRALIP